MSGEKIEVTLKLVGNLRKFGPHEREMEVEKGTTVEQIVNKYDIPPEENIMAVVNEVPKYLHYEVKDGDVVDIVRPVSGEE
ncbi:MAG: MoaD/ThiS family protein [Candidatus Aenigmatarchaeota archaeon]